MRRKPTDLTTFLTVIGLAVLVAASLMWAIISFIDAVGLAVLLVVVVVIFLLILLSGMISIDKDNEDE